VMSANDPKQTCEPLSPARYSAFFATVLAVRGLTRFRRQVGERDFEVWVADWGFKDNRFACVLHPEPRTATSILTLSSGRRTA